MKWQRDHTCDQAMKEGDELLSINIHVRWQTNHTKGITKTTEFWCCKCSKAHTLTRNLTIRKV